MSHCSSGSVGLKLILSENKRFLLLFPIKLNSKSLVPTDDPFKSPSPFNFNSGAFWLVYHISFLIVVHYNHCYSIDTLRNNLVH